MADLKQQLEDEKAIKQKLLEECNLLKNKPKSQVDYTSTIEKLSEVYLWLKKVLRINLMCHVFLGNS